MKIKDTAPKKEKSLDADQELKNIFSAESGSESAKDDNQIKKKKRKIRLWPQKRWAQVLMILILFLLIIFSAAGVVGFYTYQQAMVLKTKAYSLKNTGNLAYASFKMQDLPAVKENLTQTKQGLEEFKTLYGNLGMYGNLPIAKTYYQDGLHGLNAASHGLDAALTGIDALIPYADVLGFQGEGSFTGGTAENRIKLLLETLDKITPQLDQIENSLKQAEQELAQVNPEDYPEEFQGIKVREQLQQVKDMAKQGIVMLTDFRPVLEEMPNMAGAKGERKKYLILFQNDNELRPTGGFLTAYAVVFIEDGVVTPEKSDDIYELDKKFTKRIEIPEALGRYLTTETTWHLRDMNISPDFKVSMDQFFTNYQELRGEPEGIDGIIAVDTELLSGLLKVLGPVEVAGYGTFSAEEDKRCDCPQVVYALSEIITKPTPYIREDRKGILGPLMQAILGKAYAAPKEKWPELFELAWDSMLGRHVQLYFNDEKSQLAAENVGAAGRLPAAEEIEGDFLAIVDANLGGAKSNLFTEYEVEQYVEGPENGQITKTVEITYKNTHEASNCNLEAGELCLNSTLSDWHRLYLPARSKLVEAQGFTQEPKEYEEQGLHVIDGFFKLEPKGVAKIKVTYTVPYTLEQYHLHQWKQGGISPFPVLIDVNGGQEQLTVDQDQDYSVEF